MLKLAVSGRRPWLTANANTIREPMPAASRIAASQPTRATASPLWPPRMWVANPEAGPEGESDAGEQADQHEVVAGGRDRMQMHLRDKRHEHERDDDATAVKLRFAPSVSPLARTNCLSNRRRHRVPLMRASVHDETPQERIASAYCELRAALIAELLDSIRDQDAGFFEKLVLDVLQAMGYGGCREDAAERLGQSGDEGVDGIIREDRLVWTRSTSRPRSGLTL